MKSQNGLVLLIGLILVLMAACAPVPTPEELAAQTTCTQVLVVPVFDLDHNLVTKYVSPELKSHFEYDSDQEIFYLRPDNIEQWQAFYEPINEGIRKANSQLEKLYVNGGLISGIEINEQGRTVLENNFWTWTHQEWEVVCPKNDDPNNIEWDYNVGIFLGFYTPCDHQDPRDFYCTNTTFSDDLVYVSITTPGGSQIDYSHPREWLNQIMWSSFGDNEPLEFDPQFVSPDVLLSETAYHENLLLTLTSKGNQQEIAAFKLVSTDFQGRNELRPVIARAMEIAAVNAGHPVAMTLRGKTSNDQRVVANISAHQDAINIEGWMGLTFGEMHLQANYESYYEDLTLGSIFVLNP